MWDINRLEFSRRSPDVFGPITSIHVLYDSALCGQLYRGLLMTGCCATVGSMTVPCHTVPLIA